MTTEGSGAHGRRGARPRRGYVPASAAAAS